MLETYLHLVDGYHSSDSGFRADAKRDVALVNKDCDMLVDELRIPPNWYQLANKGLERNDHGRWVKPKRDPEDIPSPPWNHITIMSLNWRIVMGLDPGSVFQFNLGQQEFVHENLVKSNMVDIVSIIVLSLIIDSII
ncbi:UNVERIFIED_CONTAM: hypothetical protein Sradi_5962700 [Sesamum radiatum]|uniref:Phospholipase A1 n=1 Tax=Sesamum radiatum TaxID=300843 RepID=A0AAW2KGR4_SESRA